MYRRERQTQIETDQCSLLRAARPLLLLDLLQGLAFDEFHPQADTFVEIVGPENGHDIGVPDLGEHAPFLDHGCRLMVLRRFEHVQQLECHFAVEARIDRPIYRAKRPRPISPTICNGPHDSGAAVALAIDAGASPTDRVTDPAVSPAAAASPSDWWRRATSANTQIPDDAAGIRVGGARFSTFPVDSEAVGGCLRQPQQTSVIRC